MITLWKQNGKGLVKAAVLEPDSWVHVTDPTPDEIQRLVREFQIQPEVISDILDPNERSRSEREDDYTLIIVRVPVYEPGKQIPYSTIPLGIILSDELIITVCMKEIPLIQDLMENRIRNFHLFNKRTFVLQIFLRSAVYFLRYLKEINQQTSQIELDLQKSVRNNELIRLLEIEKSLVYFTTSLKGNALLLEKLSRMNFIGRDETETDLLEDALTENRQAIEMTNIYSNILSGMMDAFASVISNNLNVVMKRLTSISIILMIPTLLASIYGMNIPLPFQHSPFAFAGILASSAVLALIGAMLFLRKRLF